MKDIMVFTQRRCSSASNLISITVLNVTVNCVIAVSFPNLPSLNTPYLYFFPGCVTLLL